jgi:hypothetical protein
LQCGLFSRIGEVIFFDKTCDFKHLCVHPAEKSA